MSDRGNWRPTGGGMPDWARFFERDQLADFLGHVREALTELGVEHEVDVEQGMVEARPDGLEPRLLGLGNLAQLCRKIPPTDWSEVVAGHVGHLLRLPESDGELIERLGSDFAEARDYLKVRLFADGLPNEDQLVLRRPMEGVLSVLVYDLPDAIATVPRDHVTNWGLFDDELFELALGHVRADRPDREEVELDDGVKASLLAGQSYFSASHALLIDEYLAADARRGALVVLPHRHVVLYHEIKDEKVIPALNRLVQLAHSMHSDGPGGITPSVYWFDRRRFVRIPARIDDDSIEIYPPREFVEMLNELVA